MHRLTIPVPGIPSPTAPIRIRIRIFRPHIAYVRKRRTTVDVCTVKREAGKILGPHTGNSRLGDNIHCLSKPQPRAATKAGSGEPRVPQRKHRLIMDKTVSVCRSLAQKIRPTLSADGCKSRMGVAAHETRSVYLIKTYKSDDMLMQGIFLFPRQR